jgi:DNA repair protein RadA
MKFEKKTEITLETDIPGEDTAITPEDTFLSKDTEANAIMDLKGVGPSTYEKLLLRGFDSLHALAGANSRILASKRDLTEKVARIIISDARKYVKTEPLLNALEVFSNRQKIFKIPSGLAELDEYLKGGFEAQSLTEFYGEFATGKTQICFQAIIQFLKNNKSGKVLFIDTENTFRPERLKDIAISEKLDERELARVFHYKALTTSLQLIALERAKRIHSPDSPIKLIIVDSLTSQFRAEYLGRGFLSERQQTLNAHIKDLLKFCIENNAVCLVTNQVQSNPDSMYGGPRVKPIGGNILAHRSTYRFFIKKGKLGTRILKLVDAPDLAEKEFTFEIKQKGLFSKKSKGGIVNDE